VSAGDDEIREACAKFFTGARDRRDSTRASVRQHRILQIGNQHPAVSDSE